MLLLLVISLTAYGYLRQYSVSMPRERPSTHIGPNAVNELLIPLIFGTEFSEKILISIHIS